MATAEVPSGAELLTIIDKLASYVARNGADFEAMVKQKEANNPRFAFLFGGPHQQYYLNKLAAEKTNMHAEHTMNSQPLLSLPTLAANAPSAAGSTGASFSQISAENSTLHGPASYSGAPVNPPPPVEMPRRQSRFDQQSFPSNAGQYQQEPPTGQYSYQYPPSSDVNSTNLRGQSQYSSGAGDQWSQHDSFYENQQAYNEAMSRVSAGSNQEAVEGFNASSYDPNSHKYQKQYDYAAEYERWSEQQQYMQQQPPWNNMPPPHNYFGFPPPAVTYPPTRHAGPPPFQGGFPPPTFPQQPLIRNMRPLGPEPPFVLSQYAGNMPPASAGETTHALSSAPPPVRPRWAAPPPPVVRKTSGGESTRPGQPSSLLAVPPVVPPGPPRPWWELPAGIFVDLVPKSAIDYVALEPEQVVMPKPKPITPDLMSALEQFYDPPQPDRPRNAEGWEKLGLFEHLKMKETYKKKRAELKESAHQDDLISKARHAAKELAAKAALFQKPSSVSS